MEQLAGVITAWLIRHEAIKEGQRELYEYAVHSFFLGIAPLIYAVIIGGIAGELKVSVTLTIPFMMIRKFSGGFHAKKEWVCLVSSCLLLYGCILAASHLRHTIVFSIFVLMGVICLMAFSPVDSENRRLEPDEKNLRKRDAAIISLIFYAVYLVLMLSGKERYAICIGVGILLTVGLQMPCVLQKMTKKAKKLSFRGTTIEK